MQIAILGPLEVVAGGRRLELGAPKQQGLLALLAVESPRVLSIERIVDELWPDEPPTKTLSSLQSYVSRLRAVLEPGRRAREVPRILISQAPGYALQVGREQVDAHRFADLVQEGVEAAATRPAAALQQLTDALDLWRDEPLPELAGSRLADAERVRLNELRLTAVDHQFAALLQLGRAPEVAVRAPRVIAENPYRERLWAHLVLALYRTGRQAEALATLRRCRARLDEDLGITPGPELLRLETDILNADPRLDIGDAPPTARSEARIAAPAPVPAAAPLVGRADVLAELRAGLAALSRGAGRVVLLAGEAGIGKTALLQELAALADAAGVEHAVASAPDSDLAPAFEVWTKLLHRLLHRRPAGSGADAFADHGDLPGLLDPSLTSVIGLPAAVLPADPDLSRARIVRGLAAGLRRLAAQAPVVLAIDDAQWLDPASAGLAKLLADELDATPILLVVAVRNSDAVPGDIQRMLVDRRHVVVRLGGLTPEELDQLASGILGEPIGPDAAQALWRRTGGHPLFAGELVRTRTHLGVGASPLPQRIAEVIQRRLDALPEGLADLLAVASVFEGEFDFDVVGRLVDLDDARLFELFDTAVVSGVLVAGSRPAALRFAHSLFRESAGAQLGRLRRAHLLARAAEELRGRADPPEIAAYLRGAAPVAGPADIARALCSAADFLHARADHRQAEHVLTEALDVLATGPQDDAVLRLEIATRTRLGLLHQERTGYLDDAVAEQAEAVRLLLPRVLSGVAETPAWWFWLSFALADGTGAQALELAESLPSAAVETATVIDVHRGLLASFTGDLRSARTRLEAVLADAERVPPLPLINWDPMLGILAPLALVVGMHDEPDAAHELISRAVARLTPETLPVGVVYVLQYQAWVAFERRDPDAVRAATTRVIDIARDRQVADYEHLAGRLAGWADAVSGDAAGVTRLQTIAALSDKYVDDAQTAMFLADALLALDRPADAVVTAQAALRRPAAGRGHLAVANLQVSLGTALGRLGQLDAARSALAAAVGTARSSGYATAERRAHEAASQLHVSIEGTTDLNVG